MRALKKGLQRWTAALLATALCLSLTACGNRGGGKKIVYDLEQNPENLDPQLASDSASLTVVGNIFEGLLVKTSSGEIVPGVAESYTTENSEKRYRFTLRADATWSDGTPVTAYDFAFAFQRLFDKATRSPYAGDFFSISGSRAYYEGTGPLEGLGVKAVDERTLVIDLWHSDPFFTDLLTTPAAFPCNQAFFEGTKGGYGLSSKDLLSNGPFLLDTWIDNEDANYLFLKANSTYKSDSPVVAGSVLLSVEGGYSERKARFESGKSDCFLYREHPGGKLAERALTYDNTTWCLVLNTQRGMLQNQSVRRGLMLATDTSAIKDLLPDYLKVAGGLVPPSVTMMGQSFREYAGATVIEAPNAATAKQLFSQGLAALGKDRPESLTVLCPEGSEGYLSELMQLWQRDLNFFPVQAATQPLSEVEDLVDAGNFDIALMPVTSTQNSVEAYLGDFATGSEWNLPRLSDPAVDGLLEQINNATSTAEKEALCKQLEEVVLHTGCIIPLYYQAQFFVQGEKAEHIEYNPFFGYVKFKEARKS